MDECDVRFSQYVKGLLKRRGFTDEDETLIAARIQAEPLNSRVLFGECSALRAFEYLPISGGKKHEIYFVYLPNADFQVHGKDMAIVIHVADPNSFSGHGFEPESVARIIEMIAELTRYVIG